MSINWDKVIKAMSDMVVNQPEPPKIMGEWYDMEPWEGHDDLEAADGDA